MDIFQPHRHLQEQILQLWLRKQFILHLLLQNGISETSTCSTKLREALINHTVKSYERFPRLPTITVFILNDHVIILCPCWIITKNVWVVAKYSVHVDFLQGQLPEKMEGRGDLTHTEIKLNWDLCVRGREITCCWLTRWQSLPGVGEIVLWRISNRPASSHICKLPQTRLRRCAPAPGTRSHSETAWTPGRLVSARETDTGAETTRNPWQQEHTSQSLASSQTAATESPDMAAVPIKMLAFCCWESLTDVPETELAECN